MSTLRSFVQCSDSSPHVVPNPQDSEPSSNIVEEATHNKQNTAELEQVEDKQKGRQSEDQPEGKKAEEEEEEEDDDDFLEELPQRKTAKKSREEEEDEAHNNRTEALKKEGEDQTALLALSHMKASDKAVGGKRRRDRLLCDVNLPYTQVKQKTRRNMVAEDCEVEGSSTSRNSGKRKRGSEEETDKENGETQAQLRNRKTMKKAEKQNWQEIFTKLYEQEVPKKVCNLSLEEALELVGARPKKGSKMATLKDFFDSCVYQDPITAVPVMVATPADIIAAVGPAVAAAVGPAVAAAIAPLSAMMANQLPYKRNQQAINNVLAGVGPAAAHPLHPIRKVTAGAGAPLPGGPGPAGAGPLPVGHPFPVGTTIPIPPFPAHVAALNNLTLAQLDMLAIIYNSNFNVAAGDNVATRRTKFAQFITGWQ